MGEHNSSYKHTVRRFSLSRLAWDDTGQRDPRLGLARLDGVAAEVINRFNT